MIHLRVVANRAMREEAVEVPKGHGLRMCLPLLDVSAAVALRRPGLRALSPGTTIGERVFCRSLTTEACDGSHITHRSGQSPGLRRGGADPHR
ncbi:hypothetical protein GCM10010276_06370 [Streptomyces longisporus]|uniref:Uncharacterized protein n=1 Tax=Streptomyces longisporus TaxID=1948 RepID=A0ABN3L0D1_STRLO